MASYMLGIDVGGTFTDFVSYDADGTGVTVWKNLSSPGDPTDGILQGLSQISNITGVDNLRLGTTVATNAILQRSGATIAYVTTRGFRDIPFLQRGHREHHYDRTWTRAKPLVLRRHCFEIDERILSDGGIQTPLDETSVRNVARQIRDSGEIEAVAVNLLFSYVNPTHEFRVRDIFAEEIPDIPVSISYQVLPKWKEYERTSTTLADAYIKPILHRYLRDMRSRLNDFGLTQQVAMIKSNGGEMSLEAAALQPINLTISGPTGGVIAGRAVAQGLGLNNIVTLDMGGTSTDCSTIVDNEIAFTTNFEISFGLPIQIPMLDIRTIGAGGGSIAWLDKGGMLRVGPRSAGAKPGPACYDRGGEEPTVTDANLILGRINPQNFLGGSMPLSISKAQAALKSVAEPLGLTVEELAIAIVRIVTTNMVGALRTVLVERGLDPRDFALMTFGGAGPVHACDLMEEAGIPTAVVPIHPGQFSALGFILADARVDLERTVDMTSSRFDTSRATDVLSGLIAQARKELQAQGYVDRMVTNGVLEMRYLGQNYELEVPIDFVTFDDENLQSLWDKFHDLHERRFGFSIAEEVIELTTIKATVISLTEKPEFPTLDESTSCKARETRRVIFIDGAHDTPVYERADLGSGMCFDGPALIEEPASVTVLNTGQTLTVAAQGHLIIKSKEASA